MQGSTESEAPHTASPSETDGNAAARMDAGLFAVSAAVLSLQILQTRIFSFSLTHVTIYLAIGVCMLGLGASATVLAAFPVLEKRARRWAAFFAAASALSIPFVHAVFARTALSLVATSAEGFMTLVLLTVPYFGFGMTIALLLVCRSADIGRAYAFNLAGSAAGCLLVFPLLDLLGAESGILAIAGAGLLASVLTVWPDSLAGRGGLAAIAAVLIASHIGADRLFEFPEEPGGQTDRVRTTGAELNARRPEASFSVEHLNKRWDRTGRIDVYRIETSLPEMQARVGEPIDTLMVVQDSTAGSFLLGVGDDPSRARELFENTIYGSAYAVGPRKDVLILGLGGGPDVLSALHHGAEHVVGVDINESMIAVVRDLYPEFQGNPYQREGVEIHQVDGRNFLEATDQTFDLIEMTSVDTKTVLASGALALTNNYLYTQEAMEAMLRRLRPEGIIAITRFGDVHPFRLVATAAAALKVLGESNPELHIAMIGQGFWRSILVKRTPFDAQEVEGIHDWVAARQVAPNVVIPSLLVINGRFEAPMQVLYTPPPRPVALSNFLQALAQGRVEQFIDSFQFDIAPSRDDRPYFFFTTRLDSLADGLPEVLQTLVGISLRTTLVAVLFIVVPLLAMRRRGLRAPGAFSALAYFSCLGLGFMLIEIGLMHRFVLFLGHQSYAVTVVLFGILLGASLGSRMSSRLAIDEPGPARLVLVGIGVGVALYSFALGPIFSSAISAPFAVRVVMALGLLLPLGFVLGIPFPLGLRSVREKNLSLVAWVIGVNGLASVVGSTVAVPISMITGLEVILVAGASLYLLAVAVVPTRSVA